MKPSETISEQTQREFTKPLMAMIRQQVVKHNGDAAVLERILIDLIFYGCKASQTLYRKEEDQKEAVAHITGEAWKYLKTPPTAENPTNHESA